MHRDEESASSRDECPDPNVLLTRVAEQKQQAQRGRLRIFLGYAAGVGKTYAMLQAARARHTEGVDVVVAYVETHGRGETDALLEGLEIIPRRRIDHRGVWLTEMDLDAVMARRPRLALVDELAHTNAPGSRHAKRHQDIDELLRAGIDVYTCLNIQHLESLADAVAGITGVTMRERVPDGVLDEAAVISLVDLPPEELAQRLREGKVYVPEQAALATERFFRPGNLMALREMATRWAARRADDDVQAYMQTHDISGPWPAGERLLICVGGGPQSERLIRATRRLAGELHAEWHAVHVETTAIDRISRENRERIWRDLALAERLGARTATITGASVAEAIVRFALEQNVTKIVIGRSERPRGWTPGRRRPIEEELLRTRMPVDILLLGAAQPGDKTAGVPARPRRASARNYLQSAALVAAATLSGLLLHSVLEPTNLVMLFLVVVVIAALRYGRGPAIAAAGMSVLAFDFFFIPPRLSVAVNDTQYLLTFLGFFLVGTVVSALVSQARDRSDAARAREAQTATLFALSRDLAAAGDAGAIAVAVARHVSGLLLGDTVLLLTEGTALAPIGDASRVTLSYEEQAVAAWVLKNGKAAGRGTDTIGAVETLFLPLQTATGVTGVMGVRLAQPPSTLLPPETRHMLEVFASQAALALERVSLARRAQQARVLEEANRLHWAILGSLSHDLRTPLATIAGALSSLAGEGVPVPDEARRELLTAAREEANRLNLFVGNLMEMSRLEAGALRLRVERYHVDDLIGAALATLGPCSEGREVVVQVPQNLPMIRADFVLVVQALVKVLDNAIKYSPPRGRIEVKASAIGEHIEVAVEDQGPGLPPDALEHAFENFYRAERLDRASGSGLGLAICRGVVEAHGGRVLAENRPGGGARVVMSLPVTPQQPGKALEADGAPIADGGTDAHDAEGSP